jgi:hypothetical protein
VARPAAEWFELCARHVRQGAPSGSGIGTERTTEAFGYVKQFVHFYLTKTWHCLMNSELPPLTKTTSSVFLHLFM